MTWILASDWSRSIASLMSRDGETDKKNRDNSLIFAKEASHLLKLFSCDVVVSFLTLLIILTLMENEKLKKIYF